MVLIDSNVVVISSSSKLNCFFVDLSSSNFIGFDNCSISLFFEIVSKLASVGVELIVVVSNLIVSKLFSFFVVVVSQLPFLLNVDGCVIFIIFLVILKIIKIIFLKLLLL